MMDLQMEKQLDVVHFHKVEMIDIWRDALEYYNQVCKIVEYFPVQSRFGLDKQVKASSLLISNNIAKGSNAKTEEEIHKYLNEAIQSVYLTVSKLLISSEWKYLRQDLYDQMFEDGKLLAKKIEEFIDNVLKTRNNV